MYGACCCSIAMNTVDPNPSVSQSVCCCNGDGGASNLSSAINAVGRWGTVLLATSQGKPVQAGKIAVGARGSTSVRGMQGGSLLLIIIVIVAAGFFFRSEQMKNLQILILFWGILDVPLIRV